MICKLRKLVVTLVSLGFLVLTNFLANFFDEFFWRILMTNCFDDFFGEFFWRFFLTIFFDKFFFVELFWQIFLKNIFDEFFWPLIFLPLRALGSEYLRSCFSKNSKIKSKSWNENSTVFFSIFFCIFMNKFYTHYRVLWNPLLLTFLFKLLWP